MTRTGNDEFVGIDGSFTMKRERGLTPNGNELGGS